MLFELEGEPPRVIRAGEAFWEPGGDVIHYSDANNRDDIELPVHGHHALRARKADARAGQRRGAAAARESSGTPPNPALSDRCEPMSKILLQTTIEEDPDDWDIARFSLLAGELRRAGHDVVARNRARRGVDDPVLSRLGELDFDQLWLMAVDVGDGLTDAEAEAIVRFRRTGLYEAVPFDLSSGKVTGEPFPVLEDAQELDPAGDSGQPVAVAPVWRARLPAGSLRAAKPAHLDRRRTGTLTPLAFPARPFIGVKLSPDGRRVATASLEVGAPPDSPPRSGTRHGGDAPASTA